MQCAVNLFLFLVPASEKEFLQNELISIVYDLFLAGDDKDFDYK